MYEFWMFFLTGLGYVASAAVAAWGFRFGQFLVRGRQLSRQRARMREQDAYVQRLERYKRDTQLAFQKLVVGVAVSEDEMTKYAFADPTSEQMYPEK